MNAALTARQRRESLDLITLCVGSAALPVLPVLADAPAWFTLGLTILVACLIGVLALMLIEVVTDRIEGDQ